MADILIYGGIGVNVIGALFLMAYAMKYSYAFYKAKDNPIIKNAITPGWKKKRTIGFGLMILGTVIAVIGCYL